MLGILMPRAAMSGKPTPSWQTRFNSGLISSDKGISTWGYRRTPTPVIGSITDGTVDILSGAQVQSLQISASFAFILVGTLPNSGWEYLFVKDAILRRDKMIFSNSGGNTQWTTSIPVDAGAPMPTFTATETNILLGMA